MRIGGEKVIPVDTRIIATTNVDLKGCVERGVFREDLYYRLNILSLEIPSLNERREDVPILARAFLGQYAGENGKLLTGFEPEAMDALIRHNYSGNIRELRGLVERAAVLAEGEQVRPADLGLSPPAAPTRKGHTIQELELEMIERTLEECNHNYSQAAKRLGIDRSTLYRKLRRK